MQITSDRVELRKRHPLTISRGTSVGSTNVIVSVRHDGIVGQGEMAPSEVTRDSADSSEKALSGWASVLEDLAPTDLQRIEGLLGPVVGTGSAVRAALDMACFDWLGKRAGLPVWKILGLDPTVIVPTSVTIGINPIEELNERVPEILGRTRARVLKVKLGQQAGDRKSVV